MAMAVNALKKKLVSRIILTRPPLRPEKAWLFPGDMRDKITPYLRLFTTPLRHDGDRKNQENIEKGIIEVAPLAYMRGRTLNDSFVILDEAQIRHPNR